MRATARPVAARVSESLYARTGGRMEQAGDEGKRFMWHKQLSVIGEEGEDDKSSLLALAL
jgi:hypothetical protein